MVSKSIYESILAQISKKLNPVNEATTLSAADKKFHKELKDLYAKLCELSNIPLSKEDYRRIRVEPGNIQNNEEYTVYKWNGNYCCSTVLKITFDKNNPAVIDLLTISDENLMTTEHLSGNAKNRLANLIYAHTQNTIDYTYKTQNYHDVFEKIKQLPFEIKNIILSNVSYDNIIKISGTVDNEYINNLKHTGYNYYDNYTYYFIVDDVTFDNEQQVKDLIDALLDNTVYLNSRYPKYLRSTKPHIHVIFKKNKYKFKNGTDKYTDMDANMLVLVKKKKLKIK